MDMIMVVDTIHDPAYVKRIERELAKMCANPDLVMVSDYQMTLSTKKLCEELDVDYDQEMSRLRLSRKPEWDEEAI
jgi:hypothetical protein